MASRNWLHLCMGMLASWALVAGWTSLAGAQSVGLPAPRLLTMWPMGGKAGTVVDVTITGEHLEDAGELTFSDRRISSKPKCDAAGVAIRHQYQVTIAAECPVGLYEARVTTRLGISSSRIFAVGTFHEVMQTKTNRSLAAAQELPMNSVCNGATADRSLDYYAFQGRKGQRVVVDCATTGIDSKLHATVIIGDAAGRDLVVERRGGAIDFSVPGDGRYVIKIHELTYKGGLAFYYRLGLWEQAAGTSIHRQASTQPVHAYSWPPVGLAAQAAQTETEPNAGGTAVQRISLPCDVAGRFYPAADVDVYEFTARKGEEWWIEVASERFGLRTDPAMLVQRVIQGEPGTAEKLVDVLELSDIPSPVKVSSNGYAYDGPPYNTGTSDLLGKLVIQEDGIYRVQLTDLFGGTRSDPENRYRLVIRQAAPDFALVSWALHMELRNGDRNALSKPIALRGGTTMALEVVAFRRDGFDGEIELVMEGLPRGVTAHGLKIPAGQSRGMMLITAQADAPGGFALATFMGRASISGKTVTRTCRLASVSWPIPDSWGEIPSPRLLADVPVSVSGKDVAPLMIRAKSPVVEAVAGQKLTVPLVHQRTSEFSGDTIQMKAIGAGFEKAPAFDLPVNKDSSQVVFDLNALKVLPGEYRVSLLGGGVVKYRHRPELVAVAEAASQKKQLELTALEAEVKKVSTEAQAAPPARKEQMSKSLAQVQARMKAASDALHATRQQLNQVKAEAQPRDIVDIVVCEPFTIRIKPAEKK